MESAHASVESKTMVVASQDTDAAHNKMLFDLALNAGVILMENGAETYRVEDTVERILRLSENRGLDVIALLTGLYVTLTLNDSTCLTAVRRIKNRTFRLDRIRDVNTISRRLAKKELSIEEAYDTLEKLAHNHDPIRFSRVYHAIAAAGFALMSGANLMESLFAGFAASSIILTNKLVRNRLGGSFVPSFLQTFVMIFVLGVLARFFPMLRLDRMAVGALISLFPGTTLTNGIRDTMRGDYLTGVGNLLAAIISSMALAVGTFFALALTGGFFL